MTAALAADNSANPDSTSSSGVSKRRASAPATPRPFLEEEDANGSSMATALSSKSSIGALGESDSGLEASQDSSPDKGLETVGGAATSTSPASPVEEIRSKTISLLLILVGVSTTFLEPD